MLEFEASPRRLRERVSVVFFLSVRSVAEDTAQMEGSSDSGAIPDLGERLPL